MKLFNKYEQKIIEILLKKDKTLSEIATEIGISKPTTSMYLKRMEKDKIVIGTYEKNHIGRTIRYKLQPIHMVFSINPALQIAISFIADTILDEEFLFLGAIPQKEFRKEVKEYLKQIVKTSIKKYLIILYGSVAQGNGTRKSDIDCLFIKENWSNKDKEQVLEKIAISSNKCDHQIKPLFKSIKKFEQIDNLLQKEIKEHGIIIYEKGKKWNMIKQQLNRYKSITI